MKQLVDYIAGSWPGWLCAAVVPVVGYLYAQVRASRAGIRALLFAEITRVYNEYHDGLDYCPIHVKQSVEEIYKQYHALKGNGVGTLLYEWIINLPTEVPEKGGGHEKEDCEAD